MIPESFDKYLNRIRGILFTESDEMLLTTDEWKEFLGLLTANLITEDRIMKEYECGKRTGEDQERARIVTLLKSHAAALFLSNKDEDARRMRDLAKVIQGDLRAAVRRDLAEMESEEP